MLSIIIPTYNEEKAIGRVLKSIPNDLPKGSEVIVVDSSNDCTSAIAKELGAKVICEYRGGKGRAMRTGAKASKGEILIFLDGDGSDPPKYIYPILKKLESNDMVLGCRSSNNFNTKDKTTKVVSKIFAIFIRPLCYLVGAKVMDPWAGFRAIRKKDWNRLNPKSEYFEIETELNFKALINGFRVDEVIMPTNTRVGGMSKSKFITDVGMMYKVSKRLLFYIFKRLQIIIYCGSLTINPNSRIVYKITNNYCKGL